MVRPRCFTYTGGGQSEVKLGVDGQVTFSEYMWMARELSSEWIDGRL